MLKTKKKDSMPAFLPEMSCKTETYIHTSSRAGTSICTRPRKPKHTYLMGGILVFYDSPNEMFELFQIGPLLSKFRILVTAGIG